MLQAAFYLAAIGLHLANGQGCTQLGKSDCRDEGKIGQLVGCIWSNGQCNDPDTDTQTESSDLGPNYCENKNERKCKNDRFCMYVNGNCIQDNDKDGNPIEGTCYLAKDSPDDCKATEYCAFQLPHGNMIKRDYHRKVDEECVWIDERLGLHLDPEVADYTDYQKIDINKFCSANSKRRDCIKPRFLAFPERLRFQWQENVCQWNYNQETCRVNRVGAQYGQVVNTTATSLRQENPGYVIVDTRKAPKNRDFKQSDQWWETWDDYNDMCLNISDKYETLGGGCEERGCALFFDESMYDVTTQQLVQDAVYCVPRYPDTADWGVNPFDPDWNTINDDRFDFPEDFDTRETWIGYMKCENLSPQWCNSIPGCNAKQDPGCTKNGVTCYFCSGTPEVGGKRRRMDSSGTVLSDGAEIDPAGNVLEDFTSDGTLRRLEAAVL